MVIVEKVKLPKIIKALENVYRMVLYLLPKDYREDFGQDTILDVCQKSQEVYEASGLIASSWVWFVLFGDLLNSVVPERIRVIRKLISTNSNKYNHRIIIFTSTTLTITSTNIIIRSIRSIISSSKQKIKE